MESETEDIGILPQPKFKKKYVPKSYNPSEILTNLSKDMS